MLDTWMFQTYRKRSFLAWWQTAIDRQRAGVAFSASAVTDENGVAAVSYTIPASLGTGGKNVTAKFEGDSSYHAFTRTAGALTVTS